MFGALGLQLPRRPLRLQVAFGGVRVYGLNVSRVIIFESNPSTWSQVPARGALNQPNPELEFCSKYSLNPES